jgi:bifunctional NMN adenylyltransferase/nudix hydrolase
MEEVKKKYDIGVIIGRFQIHELHAGHMGVIEHVLDRHDKVILFLGVSQAIGTRKNPLDYTSRKKMIEETFGERIDHILPLHDMKFNCQWAKQVDNKIREIYPLGSVVLYGSRKSFIDSYEPHGKFDTCELEAEVKISATEVRQLVKNKALRSKEFRAGMIYQANLGFPFNYSVIDVAIFNDDYTKLLLGRKKYEQTFRFVGGFTDVTDETLEQTVKREAAEETNLEIGNIQYVSSRKVRDWRYRGEDDRGIITTFFMAKKIFGAETAKDDIEELKWISVEELNTIKLVDEHQFLLEDLKNKLQTLK